MSEKSLALRKQELEERKFEEELRLKKEEAKNNYISNRFSNPLVLAIIGGIIGISGNAVVSFFNNRNIILQEEKKLEVQLILKACFSFWSVLSPHQPKLVFYKYFSCKFMQHRVSERPTESGAVITPTTG
jgi:hypothetical protein